MELTDTYYRDSIQSGLKIDDGIYAVSIRLQGEVDNDISINEFKISAGNVDTLISYRDQYDVNYQYEIKNDSGGKVDLDICVSFSH